MNVKETSKARRYELVAPDGGWGYMIWIALTINMIAASAFLSSIGVLYNEIYIRLKMDSTNISLLNGITSMVVSFAGFITGPLLSCLSIRKLGLLSVITLNLGTFATVFVNSKELLFLSNGVLQGFGNGVLFNLTFTTLNHYFVKKRMLTVAIAQTITAAVSLFAPYFVKWSSDEYGSRGTLILLTGIYIQTFVAITIMQPVEWHLKKIEIETICEEKDNEKKTLLKHDEAAKANNNLPSTKLCDTGTLLTMSTEKNELNDVKPDTKNSSILRKMFSDFFDIPFLKSFLLSNASIGLAIASFSDIIFTMMLPQALYFMEWSEDEVAWAVSLSNFGELVVKVTFILFNNMFLKFGCTEIYIVGLIVAFFSRLGMLWSDNPNVMLVFISIIGMSRSVLALFSSLVIAESVDKDKFSSAMGIYMLLYGIIFLIIGPLIGAVRDLTNSYGTAFYILTSCFAIVSLFWLIELLYKKNKDKRVTKINSNESV